IVKRKKEEFMMTKNIQYERNDKGYSIIRLNRPEKHNAISVEMVKELRNCLEQAKQDEVKRSEEHTSELQSGFDIVCRLLLEKTNQSKDDVRGGCPGTQFRTERRKWT